MLWNSGSYNLRNHLCEKVLIKCSSFVFFLVIEISSDSTLSAAVEILSKHKILSALVRNVDAPEDASWIDRYIGIVEFPGIAVWLLHQV